MYSEEFMAYLAAYQKEDAKPEKAKEEKSHFWAFLLNLFGLAQ